MIEHKLSMNSHWIALYKAIFFYVDWKSKMTTTAELSFEDMTVLKNEYNPFLRNY